MAFTSVAAIEHACPDDPTRLKRLAVRFAAIALPGADDHHPHLGHRRRPRLRDDLGRRRRGDQGRPCRDRGASSIAAPRRTQSERRAETRGRLLDATIESLIEVGYAGTTIRHVTEIAGVSQGAQSHHFPHRVDLVASAFERLAEQREARYSERAQELPAEVEERIRVLLDLLWEDFSSELFTVALKLWIAAAEDDELRERLVPVEKRIYRGLAEHSAEIVGELASHPDFERRLAVAMNTVAGLALVREFDPSGRASKGNQWPYHRAALEQVLAGG